MASKESVKRKGRFDGKGGNKKHKAEETEKSSSSQKRQAKKERQSHRRHADVVAESKFLWNKLRVKTNTPDETKELMEKVMDLIRGKVKGIALQHDASRVVQAAIQFGNDKQRKELLTEICDSTGSLAEISKSQYAHFCSLKLIKCCARDGDCVKMIVKSFKGSMPKLAVHSVGSRVVESLFLNFSSKETASLKQEFYGPHFSLFALGTSDVPTLKSSLESAKTDTQKGAATNFVKEILTKGTTKSLYGLTYFQELLAEYMDVADPSDIRTFASSLADHSIHLLSTRAGTRVVAACASYGTPKDRKRICKSLKGYTSSTLLHRDAYLALLRLVQVTDDTVSIHKGALNEILSASQDNTDEANSPLLDLALSETASKLFLMLLVEDTEARMKYFDPYERSILEPQSTILDQGKAVPTSKKDPEARRGELLKYLNQGLVELCVNHAGSLLKSLPGSRVLKEVYSHLPSEELVEAIVNACESGLDEGGDDENGDEENNSLFEHPVGHRTIKNLILCDAEKKSALFSDSFCNRLGDRLTDVAKSNRGAFVAAALLKVPSVRGKVLDNFKPIQKKLKELSKKKGANAGFAALSKEVSNT